MLLILLPLQNFGLYLSNVEKHVSSSLGRQLSQCRASISCCAAQALGDQHEGMTEVGVSWVVAPPFSFVVHVAAIKYILRSFSGTCVQASFAQTGVHVGHC